MANVGATPTSPSAAGASPNSPSRVGASPPSTDSSEVTSHTSTQQWQSFEFRMRHRRAERCLLRAEMALDAGFDDEAREAIDEAERLHSDNPKLPYLRGVLADRAAASVAARQTAQQSAQQVVRRLLQHVDEVI